MVGCDHAFCIDCIYKWRKEAESSTSADDLESKRACPLCREHSDFIIPSYKYAKGDEKKRIIDDRLKARSSVPCRDFTKDGECKFGRHCHYAHLDSDGNDCKATSDTHSRILDFSDDESDDDEISPGYLMMMIAHLRRMHMG